MQELWPEIEYIDILEMSEETHDYNHVTEFFNLNPKKKWIGLSKVLKKNKTLDKLRNIQVNSVQ